MSDFEDRLRDSLAAGAAVVRPDPHAYAAVVRRRERRGMRRLVTVGVAAASVAAAGVTLAVARTAPEPAPPVAPAPPGVVAPAPKAFAAVGLDGRAALYSSDDGSRAALATPDGFRATAVAAYGDGRRFVTAALNGCRTTFTQHERTEGTPATSRPVASALPGGDVAGRVFRIAVSPDGTRLAYALRLPSADGRCGDAGGEIRVRDLRSGAERSWNNGFPVTADTSPFAPSSLTWSADGRRLSLGARMGVLDTTLPGAKVEHLQYENYDVPGYEVCVTRDRVFRGRTGSAVVLLSCATDSGGDDWSRTLRTIAFAVDPATGQPGERLFTVPLRGQLDTWFLAFDSSGDHAHVTVREPSAAASASRLYRWDRGRGVREVRSVEDGVVQIAW